MIQYDSLESLLVATEKSTWFHSNLFFSSDCLDWIAYIIPSTLHEDSFATPTLTKCVESANIIPRFLANLYIPSCAWTICTDWSHWTVLVICPAPYSYVAAVFFSSWIGFVAEYLLPFPFHICPTLSSVSRIVSDPHRAG